MSAVALQGMHFVIRCDSCLVETIPVRYGDPFPCGWETDGTEQPRGRPLHICPECRLVGTPPSHERGPFG